jgi:hypothetical protein
MDLSRVNKMSGKVSGLKFWNFLLCLGKRLIAQDCSASGLQPTGCWYWARDYILPSLKILLKLSYLKKTGLTAAKRA